MVVDEDVAWVEEGHRARDLLRRDHLMVPSQVPRDNIQGVHLFNSRRRRPHNSKRQLQANRHKPSMARQQNQLLKRLNQLNHSRRRLNLQGNNKLHHNNSNPLPNQHNLRPLHPQQ